jgi:hypothetical protein
MIKFEPGFEFKSVEVISIQFYHWAPALQLLVYLKHGKITRQNNQTVVLVGGTFQRTVRVWSKLVLRKLVRRKLVLRKLVLRKLVEHKLVERKFVEYIFNQDLNE